MASLSANIWKMSAFRLFASLHFIGGVLMPFFTEWGGLTYTQTLVLQSWFVLWVFALEVPTGALADRFGRKASLAFGMLATIAGVAAYSIIPNFYLFLFAEFLWAMGQAFCSGADEALIYDSLLASGSEKGSKSVLGKYYSYGLIGITLAAPVGGLIAASLGLRYAMLLMAAPLFFAFLMALSLKEPEKVHEDESVTFFRTLSSGLRQLRSSSALRVLVFDSVAVRALCFMVIWAYQPLLLGRGLSLAWLGVVHAAISGVQIPVLNAFERLERLTGSKKRYLFLSALIPGIAFILAGFARSLSVTIPLLVVIAGLGLTRHVLVGNYLHKRIQSKERATFMSTVSMLQKLSSGILYPFVGLLMDRSLAATMLALGAGVIAISLLSGVEESHLRE